MKIEKYYENPSALHINTEDDRAYFIPYAKEKNDRMILLSGNDWKFQWYSDYLKIPESAKDGILDQYDVIDVPSCVNMLGYENHQYANVRMPIPFDPPFVPRENPCGIYVKEFKIDTLSEKIYLDFEGVDSCYYVWVNGKFCGYSQVSHCTSEFDVTDLIKTGSNVLSVLVMKWCDGTYFEDQDKLRMSGIFRDVYLLMRPASHVKDFTVKQNTEPGKISQINLSVTLSEMNSNENGKVYCTFYCPDGRFLKKIEMNAESSILTSEIDVSNPILWNAEAPYLYTMKLEYNGEVIEQKIGLKKEEIRNGVFYLNGQNVKFKGVNRHDSNAYTGYTISKEQLIADLKLMKEHNINAIRTSHYPNSPWAYELYSEYGFYVIGEADIETHNTELLYAGGRSNYNYSDEKIESSSFGLLCSNPKYEDEIMDRIKKCVIREKNQACIVMWSLGNESGYGINMEKAASWIKSQNPDYLIHYESSIYEMPGHVNDLSNIDFYSRMYMPVKESEEYCQKKVNRPLVLCEFSHAMGNSNGDLEDYFKLIYQYDNFSGAFVWEWCDHAVYAGKDESGKEKFLYGGDFGEFPNEKNFCLDGMIYPDRRPHTGLLEFKSVARPVRASFEDGKINFYNTLDFINADEKYRIIWSYLEDGKVKEQGEFENIVLPPHKKVSVDFCRKVSAGCSLAEVRISYKQKEKTQLIEADYEVGFEQMIIKDRDELYEKNELSMIKLPKDQNAVIKETDEKIYVESSAYQYVFNKWKGVLEKISVHGNEYLVHPMTYNIWRAPTDNDRKILGEWRKAGYDRSIIRVYDCSIVQDENAICVKFSLGVGALFLQNSMRIKTEYKIYADGSLKIHLDADKDPVFPYLPRFGIRFYLPYSMEQVQYMAYGPYESYQDKRHLSYFGTFKDTVRNMHEDYLKPQENGSHYKCRELIVGDENQNKIFVYAKDFSFNVSHYTEEMLEKAEHNFELKESDSVVLCIDTKMSGIGSGSCGPHLISDYQLRENKIIGDFIIKFKL